MHCPSVISFKNSRILVKLSNKGLRRVLEVWIAHCRSMNSPAFLCVKVCRDP